LTKTDTLFDLASTSKCTTAAAVALLVYDEDFPNVQWSTPVSKLLPDDFVLPNPRLTEEVTIEDILSHRSGISSHEESYFSVRAKNPDNAKSLTRNLRNLAFVQPLRTTFIYNNIMYSVATHLVETVSGIPYAEFLKKKIWNPLGMTNTFHDITDIEANNAMDRKATPYYWDKKTQSHISMPSYPQPEGQGAGCIFSSAGDYAKWIRALLKRKSPLSDAAHKNFITPRSFYAYEEEYKIPFSSRILYSLGLMQETYRGRTLISHSGSVPGFKTIVAYMPDFDWGIVVVGNSDDASYLNQFLVWTLIDELLSVSKEERVDWSALFRKWSDADEAEDLEETPELKKPENPEPLGTNLDELTGTYYNAGYKELVIEMKDGKPVADCTDRCFPFVLTFEHLTGSKFVVETRGTWDGSGRKLRGEVKVESGRILAVGILELDEDPEKRLVWFDRVE
jgi:CubicO group peptidase (beta-lactamase class C family)